MPIEITDPADERVRDYFSLTDVALRRKLEPERGLYLAESEKVIRRALGADEPLGEVRTGRYPLLKEFRTTFANLPRPGHRDDDCNIHQSATDVDDPEIAFVVHVHFSERTYVPDVPVMRD